MSRSTLEQVLELLINEENAKAESLLHDFVVEQARQIHEDSLNESDTVVEEELEEIEESEEIESLNDDIEEDSDEIETEEIKSTKIPRIFWIYLIAAALMAAGYADFPLIAFHFQYLKDSSRDQHQQNKV